MSACSAFRVKRKQQGPFLSAVITFLLPLCTDQNNRKKKMCAFVIINDSLVLSLKGLAAMKSRKPIPIKAGTLSIEATLSSIGATVRKPLLFKETVQ